MSDSQNQTAIVPAGPGSVRLLLPDPVLRTILLLISLFLLPFQTSAQPTNDLYPIDLPTVLRLAGAQNLDIQIARQRLQEAEAERTSALERFFPWISPGISYHRRDGLAQAVPSGIISDAHFQSYSPGVVLSAQVELGEAVYHSLAARQLVRAGAHAVETQRQTVLLEAARGYFELVRSAALTDVAKAALRASLDYERQLHEAVAAGLAFKGDELRVQTQTRQYEITQRQKLEAQQLAAADLVRILHLDSQVKLAPADRAPMRLSLLDLKAPVADLLRQALAARPELSQTRALIAAARENKKGVRYGPLIPSFNAQVFGGGLGGGPDSGPDRFGAEGDYLLGLSWRIGPGGLFDSGRTRAAEARLHAAELTEARLRDSIQAEVISAAAHLQSLADQIALAESKLNSATETLRLTRERKQFGVGMVLEDLQAQQELERARADFINAVSDFNQAQYALQWAIGGSGEKQH